MSTSLYIYIFYVSLQKPNLYQRCTIRVNTSIAHKQVFNMCPINIGMFRCVQVSDIETLAQLEAEQSDDDVSN